MPIFYDYFQNFTTNFLQKVDTLENYQRFQNLRSKFRIMVEFSRESLDHFHHG